MIKRNRIKSRIAATLISLLALVAPIAKAQPANLPKAISVLSLVGDKLTVVVYQPRVGSNMDTNRRHSMAIDSAIFDNLVVEKTADGIKKLMPGVELAAINTRSAVLFDKQADLFVEADGKISVPGAILDVLKQQQATHLILITKHREESRIQFNNGVVTGDARLEGLGFFIDGAFATRSTAAVGRGKGYIAPYSYIKMRLISVTNLAVEGSQVVLASRPFSSARAQESDDPWEAMTAAEKVQCMVDLLGREISTAVPNLLQTRAGR